jgi:hypothetical protein
VKILFDANTISSFGSRSCGPPKKVRFHRLSYGNHGSDEDIHLPLLKAGSQAMVGAVANGFILQGQRNTE